MSTNPDESELKIKDCKLNIYGCRSPRRRCYNPYEPEASLRPFKPLSEITSFPNSVCHPLIFSVCIYCFPEKQTLWQCRPHPSCPVVLSCRNSKSEAGSSKSGVGWIHQERYPENGPLTMISGIITDHWLFTAMLFMQHWGVYLYRRYTIN